MKRTLVLFLILLLCMPAAWAAPALNAQMENGVLAVSWTDCGCTQATLTVYRDNWPILVCYVCGADGYFSVPGYYTQPAGHYAVQLCCSDGCVRVEAGSSAPSTPEATPTPTVAPTPCTSEPTAVPTPAPTATVSAQPTSDLQTSVSPTATLSSQKPTPVITPTATPTQKPTLVPTMLATPSPTARPTQSPGSEMQSLADEVVRQVNQERNARGLSTLSVDPELTRAAAIRAREIAESFSHTRPDGSSWSTVSDAASGENIARGHDSADRVMAAWMSSEGHRANILRASYTRIGVCAYEVNGILHWVQLFGV